ncbi:MAG: NADH-quinone oxidoreductase subunit M [Acidobacteria bacterium]|nr:NADH-quinone oxidoreductase subunit M [Acidobacteriota bacterium]MBI3282294.1 NADH-quinone oxidoreductase subunit M [Acidobacteriota bacterium]
MTLLDVVMFAPALAFALILLLPAAAHDIIRKAALALSLIVFLLSLALVPAVWQAGSSYHFEADVQWIHYPNIRYHVGMDGLGLWLVMLSTLLTPVGILVSWRHIDRRVKEFYAFLLLLEFGLIGVFVSLDLFLFYVFWEVSLVPMYFLIGIWGHERRIYAAVKFFLYTMAGSVLMLAAIIYLYNKSGTFDYLVLQELISSGRLILGHLEQTLLFLAFFFAFAIKVPLFPLHTWLPDAHVEAPTAGSVMLASVMLKMGTYGLLRFCLPLFPEASRENAPWIVVLAIVGIIYGALVAMVQPNMKKLVAYSSVSHLGFVVLGLFSFNQNALDGAVYQMLSHGISTGALFMLVGYLYERRHSLEIAAYGGVASPAPWLSSVFLITTLASIGLPTLNNFVGEFLVLQGAARANFTWAVFAATGVILSACYMLWLYQRVFLGRYAAPAAHAEAAEAHDPGADHGHPGPHGPGPGEAANRLHDPGMPDLSIREWAAMLPLLILMVWMGTAAQTFLPAIGASNARTLETLGVQEEYRVKTPARAPSAALPQEVAHAR